MIELRWIVSECEQSMPPADRMHWPIGKPYPVHIVSTKKLQYRQKIDVNVYAGLGPFPDSTKIMEWSEWKDVPEVKEE